MILFHCAKALCRIFLINTQAYESSRVSIFMLPPKRAFIDLIHGETDSHA